MKIIRIPTHIWTVNSGSKSTRFTSRSSARTFKRNLQGNGAKDVTILVQPISYGMATQDMKS